MVKKEIDKEVKKIIYSVILNNGNKIQHTYDVPLDKNEAEKEADKMSLKIINAMTKERKDLLWFDNPLICYNIDNVSCICIDTLESEELHEMIKKSQERMGFVK